MDADLPEVVEAHVSAMLAEATRLHQAAMGELHSPHDNPLPRLRKALKLLEDAEVLAQDSAFYCDKEIMRNEIRQLHQQQGQIQAMIAQLEVRSSSSSMLPWLLVVLIVVAAVAIRL